MSETNLQLGGGYTYQWQCATLLALNYFFEPVRYEPTLFDLVTDFLGEVTEIRLEGKTRLQGAGPEGREEEVDLEDIALVSGHRQILIQVKTKQADWGHWTLTEPLLLKALGHFHDSPLLSQETDDSRFVFLTNRPFNRDLVQIQRAIQAGKLDDCPEATRLLEYSQPKEQDPLDAERFRLVLARTALVQYLALDAVKANIQAKLQAYGRRDWEQAYTLLFEHFSHQSTLLGGGTASRVSIMEILGPPTGSMIVDDIRKRRDIEPDLVHVQGGKFLMGSPPGDGIPAEETDQHPVRLPPYRIGKYPVTNGEYAEFLKRHYEREHQPRQAGWFVDEPPPDKLDHPVVGVSWHSARAYCDWLRKETGRGYRLPTEAEWERAARGTEGWVYPWGNDWQDGHCTVITEEGNTTPVKRQAAESEEGLGPYYHEGASPEECFDMVGNVQEWTSTLWGSEEGVNLYPYPYKADNREDLDVEAYLPQVFRVYRGGRLRIEGDSRTNAERFRCAARGWSDHHTRVRWRGFRVACDV